MAGTNDGKGADMAEFPQAFARLRCFQKGFCRKNVAGVVFILVSDFGDSSNVKDVVSILEVRTDGVGVRQFCFYNLDWKTFDPVKGSTI